MSTTGFAPFAFCKSCLADNPAVLEWIGGNFRLDRPLSENLQAVMEIADPVLKKQVADLISSPKTACPWCGMPVCAKHMSNGSCLDCSDKGWDPLKTGTYSPGYGQMAWKGTRYTPQYIEGKKRNAQTIGLATAIGLFLLLLVLSVRWFVALPIGVVVGLVAWLAAYIVGVPAVAE